MLQARALRDLGREPKELEDHIRGFSEDRLTKLGRQASAEQRAEVLLATAGLYSQFDLHAAAEAVYRRILEQRLLDDGAIRYAVWLLDQDRADEAIRLGLQQLDQHDDVASASQLAGLLTTLAGRTGDRFPEAEHRLHAVLERHPDSAQLLVDVGTLFHVQGRFDRAEPLYRRLLDRVPNHVQALNNLALLVSEAHDATAEAESLIDAAIRLSGGSRSSRDSRAIILLNAGQYEPAYDLMRHLIAEAPEASPGFYLHLAYAALRTDRLDEARAAWDQAQPGLAKQVLLPCEQAMVSALQDQWPTAPQTD